MTITNRILIIVTNSDLFEKVGYRTELWFGELVEFWNIAEEAGLPDLWPTSCELFRPGTKERRLMGSESGMDTGTHGSFHICLLHAYGLSAVSTWNSSSASLNHYVDSFDCTSSSSIQSLLM